MTRTNIGSPIEDEILRIARKHDGQVTPAVVAAESSYSIEERSDRLDELATKGHARMDIDDQGNVLYAFTGLKKNSDK